MASKTLTLSNTDPVVEYGPPRVYSRALWANAWTLEPNVVPLECVWSAPPAMPTATLRHRYGYVLLPKTVDFQLVTKHATLRDSYIKLQMPYKYDPKFENADGSRGAWLYRDWYGLVDLVDDQLGGAALVTSGTGRSKRTTAVATGVQTFTAYGLEKLLADQTLRTSWVNVSGTATEVGRSLAFNARGRPNRSVAAVGGAFLFETDLTTAQWWSTRDIVEYLLRRAVPRDAAGTIKIPISASGLGLPNWDRPEFHQEGASLLAVLQQLVNRTTMLNWRLVVSESTAPAVVNLEVFSLAAAPITLPLTGAPQIPAAANQVNLEFDGDPLTSVTVKLSSVAKCHQVRVRGARMRAVGSFAFTDGTLAAGWDPTAETTYELGASQVTGYNALDDEEKRTRDATARSNPTLEEVFSFFTVPAAWNKTVKDGAGGAANPLFVDAAGVAVPVFLGDTFVEPTLPLYQGLDYSGGAIGAGTVSVAAFTTAINLEEMPPLVVFQRPTDATKWVAADKLGLGGLVPTSYEDEDNNRFSCSVSVPHESHGVLVRVTGEPQHAIARTDFSRLAVDKEIGGVDYRNAILTWSMGWHWAEGVYPAAAAVNPTTDAVRVLVLDAGDRYRADYVAPGTVVGVDDDGTLLRSTGGWIPLAGTGDDLHKLEALAQTAFAWFGADHYVLGLDTHRPLDPALLDIGTLIADIGDQRTTTGHRATINSVISQIRLAWPEADGPTPPPPLWQITTDHGELDPLQPGAGLGPRDPRRDVLPAATLPPVDPTTALV